MVGPVCFSESVTLQCTCTGATCLILLMIEKQKQTAYLKTGIGTSYGKKAPITKHVRNVMEGFTDFLRATFIW